MHATDQLELENAELRRRLDEAEDALRALRSGEVDAVLVDGVPERVLTLEAHDKPYRLMVEWMPQSAATLAEDGTIIYANQRLVTLTGRPRGDLLGLPFGALLASPARFDELLTRAREGEVEDEFLLRRAGGTEVPVCLGATALREGALGLCLVITDLTEQRRYRRLQQDQISLLQSDEALRRADRRKDEFLATLAHELRNPLAPITHAAQILKLRNVADPELRWAQGVIERQVAVLARLVEDLLDVSRIARGRLELLKERIELARVLEAALETTGPMIEAAGHMLTVSLPDGPLWLEGDAVRLAQAFSNLLANASKYTEGPGVIRVTAVREGPAAVVTVRDSGIGISADQLPVIFEIFAQGQPQSSRWGGLGIGLSLVKGLVELHGGTVVAQSDGPDRGSEFIVTLPLADSTREP